MEIVRFIETNEFVYSAVSHILKFGEASYLAADDLIGYVRGRNSCGGCASRRVRVNLLRKLTVSLEGDAASPAGDEGASPNFGICDTILAKIILVPHSSITHQRG